MLMSLSLPNRCMVAFPDDYKLLVPGLLIETMNSISSSFVTRIETFTTEALAASRALAAGILLFHLYFRFSILNPQADLLLSYIIALYHSGDPLYLVFNFLSLPLFGTLLSSLVFLNFLKCQVLKPPEMVNPQF